jgi:hypothetical protein
MIYWEERQSRNIFLKATCWGVLVRVRPIFIFKNTQGLKQGDVIKRRMLLYLKKGVLFLLSV